MKTQYAALLLVSFLIFNCSSDSGGGDDILNGRNYISENDFCIYYLSAEIEIYQTEIDSLQLVIDNMMGDAETTELLDQATTDRDELVAEREQIYLSGNPVPINTPPDSCPEVLTCFTSDAIYMVTANFFSELDIIIYDEDFNTLADTYEEPLDDLPGVNDYKYKPIAITPHTGPVILSVSKLNTN